MISKHYKVIEWNSKELKHKTPELTHYLQSQDIDIALSTETILNESDKTNITNYEIYRNDRPTYGGRVAIIIKQSVTHVLIQHLNTNLEIIGIKIASNIHIFVLCVNQILSNTPQHLNKHI